MYLHLMASKAEKYSLCVQEKEVVKRQYMKRYQLRYLPELKKDVNLEIENVWNSQSYTR